MPSIVRERVELELQSQSQSDKDNGARLLLPLSLSLETSTITELLEGDFVGPSPMAFWDFFSIGLFSFPLVLFLESPL